MATKIEVILPVLKNRGGDLKKEWYVEYACYSDKENKLLRFRKTHNINRLKTAKERVSYANKIITSISSDLKEGWRPWLSNKIIYRDYIEYDQIAKTKGRLRYDSKQLNRLISEYLSPKGSSLKKKSYQTYVSIFRVFCQFIEKIDDNQKVLNISNEIIIKFWNHLINQRKLDKKTMNRYKTIINSFFKYLLEKKIIDENPVYNLPVALKTKDEAARPINKIDLKILLEDIKKTDQQLHLACLFEYYAAVRPGNEMRTLKIKDCDFYNNRIIITEVNAKTTRRCIDMPKQLVDICFKRGINKYDQDCYVFGKDGIPGFEMLSTSSLRRRFNKHRDKLNMPKIYKLYSFKHTGAGMALASGTTLEELRSHLGHSSIETTDHYVKKHFGNRNDKIISKFPKPY